MPDPRLGLAQLSALRSLFEQYDSRTALEAFVTERYEYHSSQCAEEMVNKREDIAREHAYFARCYRALLNDLKEFIRQQQQQ